jgi:acyl-CoA reductase-like NAD-dependent aldehyde dehydrogenase
MHRAADAAWFLFLNENASHELGSISMSAPKSTEFKLLINGNLVSGDGPPFPVINPSNGQIFAYSPQAAHEQVDAAVRAASSALKAWACSLDQRRSCFLNAYAALKPHVATLAGILHAEQGKPLADAIDEVENAILTFKRALNARIPVTVVGETEAHVCELHRRPLGIVAAIVPWNYPVHLAIRKICEALIYGNTVVLKPSPFTPLATLKLCEILRSLFPPGVLNVLAGVDSKDGSCVGEQLASHPLVAMISFTGSIATGKRIAQHCSAKLARSLLELGGNDPAIVLQDADVCKTAERVLQASLINNGQLCCAVKRVYVHKDIYDAYVEETAKLARAMVGCVGVTLGPLNNAAQYDRVVALVDDAVSRGGKVVAGGKKPKHVEQAGYFYEPTVIANVAEGIRLVDEEQFGPVLPIMSFEREEEVITRANRTPYGLGASVWGTDPVAVNRVACQMEAGMVWTNEHAAEAPGLPAGGAKQSGIGRSSNFTEVDLNTFTESHSVKVLKCPPGKNR